MRRAVWQWLLMSFALVWGASGCNCGTPPVESALEVDFARPTDGQRLALVDDADPATDGFQYDVEAVARDTADRPVTIASAKLELRAPSEQVWRAGPEGIIDGAVVRFPGALLLARTNVLQVTVEEAGSRRTATRRISVTVSTEAPTVDLTQPAEGQVLRESDDADPGTAGYQLRFTVKSTGLAGKTGTLYCEQACGVPATDFTVNSSGVTQLSVTLGQAACESERAACYAVVRTGEQSVTSTKRNILLDTVAPQVEVAGPFAPVASTTFRVEATVGCIDSGMTATLSRPNAPDLSTQVVAGSVSFPTVTVPVDGEYLYTLRVADEGGNVTTREIPVTVASAAPSLTLLVAGSVTSDGSPQAEGIQIPVSVQVDTLPVGTEVRLFTSVTGQFGRPQRVATVQAGTHRVASFTANLAEGVNTVQACVSNAAGIEQCAVESVTVSTGRPLCRIISPVDGALTRATSTQVRVESGNGPISVVARDASGTPRGQASGTAASGSGQLALSLPGDGEYTLVATCPGSNATSQALSLGVDTTAPALSFNVRGLPAGQTTLGSGLNDTSLSPGMQIALEVATEPRASVTATGCGMTAGVTGQADASGALVLRDVSVPSRGTCELRLVSTDPAGNTTPQTQTLTLAFAGGELRFISPEAERYLGASDGVMATPGAGLTVAVRLAVTPTVAGTLRLLRGTTEIASVPVALSDTEKTFTGVVLEEGANVLRAELIGPGGIVACATVLLLVDTLPGNIVLEIPAPPPAPAPVYIVSTDVTPGREGIQYQLRYSAPGRSPNAVVDLCTDVALTPGAAPCRDGSGWFTLASNVPAFSPEFTYPDGRYTLKAVLDDGAISVSEEVPIWVDSVEPVVRAVELLGDTNGDKRLNAVELPTGAPQLRIAVDGLEPGRSVQVRNASNLGVIYGQATVTDGQATVSLSSLPTGIAADYALVVTVTDAAGNANRIANPTAFYPLNTAAFFSFRLDRVAPSLVVSAPTRNVLGIADDGSSAPGFQLRVTVNTDTDVGAGGVRMELTPSGGAVDLTPTSLAATHEYTLPSSGKVTYTLTITATDTSGNRSAQVLQSITVDLEAPVVDLVTPMAGTLYTNASIPVRVDVGSDDVGSVRIFTQVDGGSQTIVGDLPVSSGVAQGTLNFPTGVQTVSVEATDTAGNTARDLAAGVDVRLPCPITLTTPSAAVVTLLSRDDRDPATPGLQYRLIGSTPACGGRTVSLYRGGSSTPEATTTADATTGDFFFDVTLSDGEHTVLTIEVFSSSGAPTTVSVDVTVDITPPLITSVSPSPTTLYFVASTNVFLLPTPAPDRVVDAAPGGDANATFTLTVIQAVGSKVQAFYRGSAVSSEFSVTTDPQTLEVPVTLPQDTVGTLELRVQDVSGNVTSHSVAATVDVVPPATPTVTRTLVAGQERTARVEVTWTASGDDGTSGVPVGYDLRWTTNALLQNGIQDTAAFFGTKVRQETGNLLPAGTTRYTLTVPPLARYSIQVRPRDEVGNYAPFVAETAQEVLSNFWTSLTLTNPGAAGNNFGLYINSRGDLNADGFDDLVVAAASSVPGTAHIYYGKSNPTAANPPLRQDLTLPETGSQFYGADFDVGDAGNPTADVVQDLLLGVRGYATNSGRAFLYFGRKNTTVDTTGPIEFRGPAGATLGGTVKMIGDITGDGLQELALSAHTENPPKVYIFYGRSPSAWRALGTGCSATAPCVVTTSSADKVITGPANTPVVNFFGRNRGYTRLGDITGDGVEDFTLPHSFERINNLYVYSGSTVRSANPPTLADALQVLHQGPNTGGSLPTSFGTEAVGGVNLAGGPRLDLVVSQALLNKVYVFRDGGPSGFTTAPLEILGGSRLGNALAQGDLNGDGRPDLAIGQNLSAGGSAFVFYNRGIPGEEFDTMQENGFSQSKVESASSLGITLTILDFNGDGKPDLAAGDSQSNPARVMVYY
ncbi:FG-GAP repeat domain-containing protein [Hyalangium rubrum]|uniref:VCBS repeat-containing protein n=1 Tax=Hyalangium rubrum TaxID=3103134 RepID=A0ABU5HEQ2_9BACT|nr:VCBS repeat-containing protein [Hyalangium sp. s54d21]MDY7231933.1 VCBS repeat-containing protein [Hyalangium sp. s54d21]